MSINWSCVKEDLVKLGFNISKIIVVVVFVFTLPVGFPLIGFIYWLQDRYSTNEVNEYVALYLAFSLYILILMIKIYKRLILNE